jgi:hypothetical protein
MAVPGGPWKAQRRKGLVAGLGAKGLIEAQGEFRSRPKQSPDYFKLARRVESDPHAHALSVYNGRERLGSIIEIGGARFAFGPLDESLGAFATRTSAAKAVAEAFRRREAAAA